MQKIISLFLFCPLRSFFGLRSVGYKGSQSVKGAGRHGLRIPRRPCFPHFNDFLPDGILQILFPAIFPFCDFYKNLKFRKNPQKKNNYNIFKANALIYRYKYTCKDSCKNLPRLANSNFVEYNIFCINKIILAHRKIQYVNIFQYSVKSTSRPTDSDIGLLRERFHGERRCRQHFLGRMVSGAKIPRFGNFQGNACVSGFFCLSLVSKIAL